MQMRLSFNKAFRDWYICFLAGRGMLKRSNQ